MYMPKRLNPITLPATGKLTFPFEILTKNKMLQLHWILLEKARIDEKCEN